MGDGVQCSLLFVAEKILSIHNGKLLWQNIRKTRVYIIICSGTIRRRRRVNYYCNNLLSEFYIFFLTRRSINGLAMTEKLKNRLFVIQKINVDHRNGLKNELNTYVCVKHQTPNHFGILVTT